MGSWNRPKPGPKPSTGGFRTVIVKVWKEHTNLGIAGAQVHAKNENYERTVATTRDGIAFFLDVPESVHYFNVDLSAPELTPKSERIVVPAGEVYVPPFYLAFAHADPWAIPVSRLLAIRGSMFTARFPVSQGPRAGTPDAINVVKDLYRFPLAEQDAMLASYTGPGRRYTHVPTGPFGEDVNYGYHDMYGPAPSILDAAGEAVYANHFQKYYDNNVIPILMFTIDNYTIDQMRQFERVYRSDLWQKLVRLVVPYGWEPNSGGKYMIQNRQFVERFEYVRDIFPKAYHLLHLCTDDDAPMGSEDNDLDKNVAWQNLAAAGMDGWLDQIQGYLNQDDGRVITPEFRQNLKERVELVQGRFRSGQWGRRRDGGKVLYYGGEFAASNNFHKGAPNWPEAGAQAVGDLFMECGADGYLDGGTVDVPDAA